MFSFRFFFRKKNASRTKKSKNRRLKIANTDKYFPKKYFFFYFPNNPIILQQKYPKYFLFSFLNFFKKQYFFIIPSNIRYFFLKI